MKEKTLYCARLVLIALSAAALRYAIGTGDTGGGARVAPMVTVFAGTSVAIGWLR